MPRIKLIHGATPDQLPTTWDAAEGRGIRWEPWQTLQVFVCPPPKKPHECERCGSIDREETCVGTILPRRGETFEITEDREVQSKRVKDSSYTVTRTRHVPAWPVARLVAFRCPACMRIDIFDEEADRG